MSINSVTLTGRAGRDPEVKYFESGSCVAQFSIAVDRYSKEGGKEVDWINIKLWGKQAQVAADYVRKGSLVGIVGRLEVEKWADRQSGEERSKAVVVGDRLELLSSKRDAAPPAEVASDEEVPF
jgi:single-strand DNA-binding protein